jgi:uncharacterized protein
VVLVTALLLGLLGALASSRLGFRTSFAELLPDDDPGVVTLRATQKRMGDLTLLLVGVRSPDLKANERYAEALTSYLRALPPAICEFATYHVRDIHQFINANRWLYAAEQDLVDIRERLRREVARRKNPLIADLGLSDPDEEDAEKRRLEQRMQSSMNLGGRFPDGLFRNAEGTTVWVTALPPGGLLVENAGVALLNATQDFIRRNPPAKFHPQMDVEATGPIVTPIRNRQSLEKDLAKVATLCGLLIPLAIGLYFRRVRAVLFVTIPAALATLLAYGVAYLVFGYLTTVTSFLVSFIMGNGTNYAIVLLARYHDLRRQGRPTDAAVSEAIDSIWRSTGIAAIASAASYLSLLVTSFRGFSQFGLIGAAGCLLAWLTTFTVMPAMLRVFDRRAFSEQQVRRRGFLLPRLARLIERRPAPVLLASAVVTAVMVVGVLRFGQGAFEYDFRKLSTQGPVDTRAQSFDQDQDKLFGRWPHPTVVVTDSERDVMLLKTAIRQADARAPGNDVVGQMLSVHDLLPGTTTEQQRKLAVLDQIRKLTEDPAMQLLDDKDRQRLADLRPPSSLQLVHAQDLPPLARRPFTEADGTIGRVLLLYPPEKGLSIYDGRALLRTAAVLQRVPLADGREVHTSGSAVIFAAMIRSILTEGRLATICSFSAVLLLVLLRVRPLKAAMFVIGALLTGVLWMVGIAGWLQLKITFLNFIALPFIFGVGVEYAIHVVAEYAEHRSVSHTVLSAGGPVALCSFSAIVGYGSLLAANNGALRGLGGVATLGEVTCLLAAVLVTPALFAWARISFGPLAQRQAERPQELA